MKKLYTITAVLIFSTLNTICNSNCEFRNFPNHRRAVDDSACEGLCESLNMRYLNSIILSRGTYKLNNGESLSCKCCTKSSSSEN